MISRRHELPFLGQRVRVIANHHPFSGFFSVRLVFIDFNFFFREDLMSGRIRPALLTLHGVNAEKINQ